VVESNNMTKIRLEIDALGGKGDGIATDGTFVPFTLAGDVIEVDSEEENPGLLPHVVKASPHRIEPICQHFGTCGGCVLQHFEQQEYLNWKRQLVVDAFASSGIDAPVEPCIPTSIGQRRRASFTAIPTASGTVFGFLGRQSHGIVDLGECPLLLPMITERFDDLRNLAGLAIVPSEQIKLHVLACDNGLDIALEADTPLSERRRKAIIDWAVSAGRARVSYGDEVIIQTIMPQFSIGQAILTPPPGSFVQAVAEAEQHMADLIAAHLKKSKKIIDMFSGVGTFGLQLLHKSSVHAVEFEKAALLALEQSQKSLSGAKTLTIEARDLERRPLQTRELEGFSGAIFDPPRAGAEAQTRELAKSAIPKIAAVSCNPTTLARDAKILLDAGYKLTKVVPIDQFLFSAHVEVVALFERKKQRVIRPIFG